MSKYTMYYNKNKKLYLNFANSFTNLVNTSAIPEENKRGLKLFFRPIARRFGLITEFKDLGVL